MLAFAHEPPQPTAENRRRNGLAYPRLCRVPGNGFSGAGIDPHAWLIRELGLGGFALHSAGRMSRDVSAVYFRTLADLQRFLDAFPTLQLADDTGSKLYQSPNARR